MIFFRAKNNIKIILLLELYNYKKQDECAHHSMNTYIKYLKYNNI